MSQNVLERPMGQMHMNCLLGLGLHSKLRLRLNYIELASRDSLSCSRTLQQHVTVDAGMLTLAGLSAVECSHAV